MAMTKHGCLTHLVSQNKCIRLWHQKQAHINNMCILRVAKFVDGMKLDIHKEYNPGEMLINCNNSDTCKDEETVVTIVVCQTMETN